MPTKNAHACLCRTPAMLCKVFLFAFVFLACLTFCHGKGVCGCGEDSNQNLSTHPLVMPVLSACLMSCPVLKMFVCHVMQLSMSVHLSQNRENTHAYEPATQMQHTHMKAQEKNTWVTWVCKEGMEFRACSSSVPREPQNAHTACMSCMEGCVCLRWAWEYHVTGSKCLETQNGRHVCWGRPHGRREERGRSQKWGSGRVLKRAMQEGR